MTDFLLTLLDLAVTTAKVCGPGDVRAVMAENLLLKQQLIVLRRARRRAPNLTQSDRLLCGFWSLFLSPERIRKVAIALRPSTLLTFHQALVRRKVPPPVLVDVGFEEAWPERPDQALIRAIVELKSRNPRFGCPRIARIISREFLDQVLFWNARDLERKLAEFQAYYNAARGHASLEGYTPLTFVDKHAVAPADLSHVRWVSHRRELVQLPVAA